MKVILLESTGNLGMAGDVVKVRPGYARNYLFPRGKAITANTRNLRHLNHQKLILEHKLKRAKILSEEKIKTIESKEVIIRKKSGEQDKLFGSVTSMDIENALKEIGVAVSRKAIRLAEPIKKAGSYKVPVKLDGGLDVTVSIEVKAEKV